MDDAPLFVGDKRLLEKGPSGDAKRLRKLLNPLIEEVDENVKSPDHGGDVDGDEGADGNVNDDGVAAGDAPLEPAQPPMRRIRSKQGPKQHYVVPEAGFEWGPFEFKRLDKEKKRGKNKGQIITSFQCICKFHRDAGAPAGTHCQRTRQFTPENRDEIVRQLKVWALLGRECDSHAAGDTPHVGVNLGQHPDMSMDDVENELINALSEPDWLIKTGDDVVQDDPPENGGGDSHAGSS